MPADWKEADSGQVRAASFSVHKDGKQADVGVVPMPGMMGGDLENVNRWRSTVGLAAVTEADLPRLAESVQIAGQTGQLYDIAGENPGSGDKTRLLVAVLKSTGIAWFFKMNGDDALVAGQKPAFLEFLKSVSFQSAGAQVASAQGAPMQGELPPSHPPIDTTAPQGVTGQGMTSRKPKWEVPSSWKEIAPGQFLVAKFVITGAETTQVNVSMSAGTGGGFLGNVNRWRGQLGLGELPESEISKLATPLETPGGKATLVDFSGIDARTGQKARLVGAVVPQSDRTWFYKLMGDEQVVGREKDAFSKFIQTAKYPDAA
jgi:hypothetical protein